MGPIRKSGWNCLLSLVIIILITTGCTESDSDGDNGPETPVATVLTQMRDNNFEFFIANITLPTNQNDTRYQLINGTEVVEHNGTTIEGLLLDISYDHKDNNSDPWPPFRDVHDGSIEQHVSFFDSNSDGYLSKGDVIMLLGAENNNWNGSVVEPGVADSGMQFRLIFEPNDEIVATVELT